MSAHVNELNVESFRSTTAEGLTLVDFWAPWCGPCQIQGPILEAVAQDLGKLATIAKVNIDEHPSLASEAGVQSIPTLILYRDGKVLQTLVGVQQKDSLITLLKRSSKNELEAKK